MGKRGTIVCMVLFWLPLAQAEIYRCTDADGNVMFSQTPCQEDDAEPADEQPADEEAAVATTEVEPQQPDTVAVAECKRPYHDAIDEIDAEMREGYSPAQGEVLKQRLRGLTEQLRRCET